MRTASAHRPGMSALQNDSDEHPRVFVLEDDPGFRAVLVELLADEGLEVSTCDSVASLREAMQTCSKAVVVADFWGTSHHELSAIERSQIADLGSQAPTILLSGRAWAEAATPEELEVASILRKPVTLDDVVAQVRRCLAMVAGD